MNNSKQILYNILTPENLIFLKGGKYMSSFQNRLDELNERRDLGELEIDKMHDEGAMLRERDQGEEELDDLQDQYEAELRELENEGDAYDDEGDAYDRVQYEAEMQLLYGLDADHDLGNGFQYSEDELY